ncbi:sterol carrier family protein [Streptomyces sp. NPDC051577]|uniref:maleylpyruvate isomerase family mycothiol-dependent enzyme n=1 Tax=Streptomyces sp. NPDC051577 TaxID=3155166 RepID=UPI003428E430
MPTARKKPRTYDSARIRAAVTAQFDHIAAAVATLTPEQLARPTHLGDWTVRDLAAHIAWIVRSIPEAVALPEPAKAELTVRDWPFATSRIAARIDELARETAAGEELGPLYEESATRLAELLRVVPDGRLLGLRVGAMAFGPFMVTRTVELVVHTDDLNRAADLDVPIDRQALAACTRLLADALADRAPGGSVELRIPPFAVVQCLEGPRHTRGTPPNVVESDPLTWIRLATGRTTWDEALQGARLSASGERADLGALLPLMG